QERTLAGEVVLDLRVEVVALRQLQFQAVPGEEAAVLGLQAAVAEEGGDVAAPEDVGHLELARPAQRGPAVTVDRRPGAEDQQPDDDDGNSLRGLAHGVAPLWAGDW